MHFVDILIPLIVGVLLLMFPSLFICKGRSEEQREQKRRLSKKIGWLLIGVSILYLFSKVLIGPGTQEAVNLEVVAKEINKLAPMMIDSDTQFDKVTSGNKQLIYHLTLVNHQEAVIDKVMFSQGI